MLWQFLEGGAYECGLAVGRGGESARRGPAPDRGKRRSLAVAAR